MNDIYIPAQLDLRKHPSINESTIVEIIKSAYEAAITVEMIVINQEQMRTLAQDTAARGRANLARAYKAGETDEDIINMYKGDAEIEETLASESIFPCINMIVTSYGETKVSLQAYPGEPIR